MTINITELHIEILRRPKPAHHKISIYDEQGNSLFTDEPMEITSEYMLKVLSELKHTNIIPSVIYIEPFSDIEQDVRSVWNNARILLEYN